MSGIGIIKYEIHIVFVLVAGLIVGLSIAAWLVWLMKLTEDIQSNSEINPAAIKPTNQSASKHNNDALTVVCTKKGKENLKPEMDGNEFPD